MTTVQVLKRDENNWWSNPKVLTVRCPRCKANKGITCMKKNGGPAVNPHVGRGVAAGLTTKAVHTMPAQPLFNTNRDRVEKMRALNPDMTMVQLANTLGISLIEVTDIIKEQDRINAK